MPDTRRYDLIRNNLICLQMEQIVRKIMNSNCLKTRTRLSQQITGTAKRSLISHDLGHINFLPFHMDLDLDLT
ncbi:hypothetical protein BpHYR1_050261 [Brachionus plicatilis]|uniref:Uncharacterized protein n=1 Tax=Brachionus plicatilis TaxID=10195 RepID=A0A3M7RVH5_BRAPC|nr:hypothetical protein BpHYR1_050261 [Brachionus plicatilis]